MTSDYNQGEPTGEVNQWNTAAGYTEDLNQLRSRILQAQIEFDLQKMIRLIDGYYTHLRITKDKNKSTQEFFDESKDGCLRDQIEKLQEDYNDIRSIRTTRTGIQRRDQLKRKLYTRAREIYQELNQYMSQEQLVFDKGLDPTEAWAKG